MPRSHHPTRIESSPEADALEGPRAETERAKRTARPSAKRKENDADRLKALEKRLNQVEKENMNLKKAKKSQAGGAAPAEEEDEEEYESEEKDDDAANDHYQSAFQSGGIISSPEHPRRLRHAGEPTTETADAGSHAEDNIFSRPSGSDAEVRTYTPPPRSPSTACATQAVVLRQNKRPRAVSEGAESNTENDLEQPPRKKPAPPLLNNETPTGAAKVGDYEPYVRHLILRAIRDFESRVITEDAFPSVERQAEWAISAWSAVQIQGKEHALPDRILSLITDRTSRIRGALRDKIRPTISSAYGFEFDTTPEAIKQNYLKYQALMNVRPETNKPDPVFHYKDVENKRWYARHPVVLQAIREAWFPSNGQKLGIMFRERFDPIPLNALALIFTAIHYCLDQWADGTSNSELGFTEVTYKSVYQSYRTKLQDWKGLNPDTVNNILKAIHDSARRASGAPVEEVDIGLHPDDRERVRAELEEEANAGAF